MKLELIVAVALMVVGIITALYIAACRLSGLFDAIDAGDV
jgi:hypothetical protein